MANLEANITGGAQVGPVAITVTRGPESWQLFAFVFGAAVAVGFGFLDEIGDDKWKWRLGLKIDLCLSRGRIPHPAQSWGRNKLAGVMHRWTIEGYFP